MSDRVEIAADAIPDELAERDQWLFWNARSDRPRMPLADPDATRGCAWSDPETWTDFETATAAAADVDKAGIGYVNAAANDDFARGLYATIDIDGCVGEDGHPKGWLPSMQPFFDHDAYMEYSPSGEGIHIPVVGLDVPDWWADQHFSDDEHEGVEVLANKFSTVTGDALRGSGADVVEADDWLINWLAEVYQVLTGEDPLATDTAAENAPTTSGAHEAGDRDEWLDEDVAREALDHISPDCTYSTWMNIGMALANHFGETAGQRLFESWSRGGSKWDSEAERQAERIINDASNYDFGIGTLVKHASGAGWDASAAAREHGSATARSDGGTAAATGGGGGSAGPPEPGDDGDSDTSWSLSPLDVLRMAAGDVLHPLGYDDEGNFDGGIRDIRTAERANYVWQLAQKTGHDDVLAQKKGPIYAYNDGVWRDDDLEQLRQVAGEALDIGFSKSVVSELEAQVRKDCQFDQDELGAPEATIMTESGLLDLRNRESHEPRPEHLALAKIPTEYDPSADCPRWREFVETSVDTEAERKKLQEYAGYCLWRHSQDFGKALFLVGPTDSGKGTALKGIKQVLGRENVAAESLNDLIQTRWGAAQLFGNIANIRNEVTPSGLSEVQKFKEFTGGEDEVSAEFKGQDKFQFVVTQKFLFSTNEVPTVENADEAFYNRLLFVRFPNTVPPEAQDRNLLEKFADEKPGMLNWMLDGLDRLLDQGTFTGERSTTGKKEICDAFGGVLDRFVHNCLMVTGNPDDVVDKSDLHDLAQAYAEDIDKEPEWNKQNGFTREIGNQRGIDQQSVRITGDVTNAFVGVRVKPEVVYRYDMDICAKTSDADEPDATGLHKFDDEDLRPGYDSGEELNILPRIVKEVRAFDGDHGMPHDELVALLGDIGVDGDTAEQKIDKALSEGRIQQPTAGHYRAV